MMSPASATSDGRSSDLALRVPTQASRLSTIGSPLDACLPNRCDDLVDGSGWHCIFTCCRDDPLCCCRGGSNRGKFVFLTDSVGEYPACEPVLPSRTQASWSASAGSKPPPESLASI
jgi:hypothetical protein